MNVPPHLASLAALNKKGLKTDSPAKFSADGEEIVNDDIDPGSAFSDTVTEKIRVKVSSFFDEDKSDPANGKYIISINCN